MDPIKRIDFIPETRKGHAQTKVKGPTATDEILRGAVGNVPPRYVVEIRRGMVIWALGGDVIM